jgi:hypothetical protein
MSMIGGDGIAAIMRTSSSTSIATGCDAYALMAYAEDAPDATGEEDAIGEGANECAAEGERRITDEV